MHIFRMPENVYVAKLSKSFYFIRPDVRKPLRIEKSELAVKSLPKGRPCRIFLSAAVEAKGTLFPYVRNIFGIITLRLIWNTKRLK